MQHNIRFRKARRNSGFSLIEVLVAGLIISTSVVGMMQFAIVDFGLTSKSISMSAACTVGRSAIEAVRLAGFANAVEGTQTTYYDSNGSYPPATTSSSLSTFAAQTTIVSDLLNGSTPAPGALRTVTVTVSLISTGQVVYQTYTTLASGGV